MDKIIFLVVVLLSVFAAGAAGVSMVAGNNFDMFNGGHGMMGNHGMMGDHGMMDECGEMHDEMQEHCDEHLEEECEENMHEYCEHDEHELQ
jgi:hypothetical protein